MNNCRFKLLLHFPLLLLLVLSGLYSSAQRPVLNKPALQKVSQDLNTRQAALRKVLLKMAKDNGWPLTMHLKKGRTAYLQGLSSTGKPLYVGVADNIISAATIGTNTLWSGGSSGLNLNGSSAALKDKIGLWDEGKVRPTHVELTGRTTWKDATNDGLVDHSTHVAGTMIATGVNPLVKGMANGAQMLDVYDFDNDLSEMTGAAANGMLVSNHSYAIYSGWDETDNGVWYWYGRSGDTVDINFGLYDAYAKAWDTLAYAAPNYLMVKAAGNNRGEQGPAVGTSFYRYDASYNWVRATRSSTGTNAVSSNGGFMTIATYGNAKNILTIGAVNPIPGGYTQPSDVVLADFSSVGPTGDGRIKPDLVADGVNVLSSVSTADNAYDIMSGTSMATPASSGSAFLLQEYWSRMHGGEFMLSSTLKGLLIHTADEAGPTPGPDYGYGWGLIDMKKAAQLLKDDSANKSQQVIESVLNADTAAKTFKIIASGKMPVSATICWTDVPAIPAGITNSEHNFVDAGSKLINDLDLRITDSATGKVYMPWTLSRTNPGAAAVKGDNKLDNVEKVEMSDSVVPGRTYLITVSHKGTLSSGHQAYSLLISGAGGTAACTSASTTKGGASITTVTIGGFNYTPAQDTCRDYTDYSSAGVASLPIGGTVPVSITHGVCSGAVNPRVLSVYIDYANNGNFTLVSQSPVESSTGTYSGSFIVPDTLQTGTYARMRIIAEETSTPSAVTACGNYTLGETQDYKVTFTNPTVDVGAAGLAYPAQTACASDSQIVSVLIHNYGAVSQSKGVPVTTVVKNSSGNVVATLNATCMDSIPAGAEVVFTYNQTIQTIANDTYTFVSTTSLSGDVNTGNDASTASVTATGTTGPEGTATTYGKDSVLLTVTGLSSALDIPIWYTSATGGTPVATGTPAYTTTIPNNRTYYVASNDLTAKIGPASKTQLGTTGNEGVYTSMIDQYPYVKISTSQPLTIESAKMYTGYSGQVTITLAVLYDFYASGGSITYEYIPYYATTIDVAASKAVPDTTSTINVAAGDNSDTGATYLLNIPVPTPGNYILIVHPSNNASLFMNTNISKDPYPFTLPGVMSIYGNSYQDNDQSDSLTVGHKYYFPFYNMGIKLSGCPSTRTAVHLAGGSDDNLFLSPNPTHTGTTKVQFSLADPANTSIVVEDITGKKVYQQDLGVFSGYYSQDLSLSRYANGVYVVLVYHGGKLVSKKELSKY